jgi:hypothetical protein
MSPDQLVAACRVPDGIAPAASGLWKIERFELEGLPAGGARFLGLAPYVSYTVLFRTTIATLHQDRGEIVMEDSPRELRRHLPILLNARGRVLVTGLGLGCVLRGLLAKPDVDHVDVIEIDPVIIELVGPEFERDPRVTLHAGDALTYDWPRSACWDFAWHDVWCEDGSLNLLHANLLARYRDHAPRQGAWQFDRKIKRVWPDRLVNSRRRLPAVRITSN